MPRLKPNERRQMVNMVRKGVSKKLMAETFGVIEKRSGSGPSGLTAAGGSFKDKPRKPRWGKITRKVELSINELRIVFGWGTARIQQVL